MREVRTFVEFVEKKKSEDTDASGEKKGAEEQSVHITFTVGLGPIVLTFNIPLTWKR